MCQLNWTKYHANQLPQMSCEIDLDQQEPCYSVGDLIAGQVRFNISKPFYTYGKLFEITYFQFQNHLIVQSIY